VEKYNLASDIIISANVLNHVDDLCEFMISVDKCLSVDGMFVFQVPYAPSLIDNCYFETIYHEHTNYFSAASINKLLSQHSFTVEMAEINEYMCDSIRVYCKRGNNSHCYSFQKLLSDEKKNGYHFRKKYDRFANPG
jgi:2-polyprenyl-3-methyl-5-hydroxy-6-metoxy-1,4-benzoquinol methylase